jgi:hypothetical protein
MGAVKRSDEADLCISFVTANVVLLMCWCRIDEAGEPASRRKFGSGQELKAASIVNLVTQPAI